MGPHVAFFSPGTACGTWNSGCRIPIERPQKPERASPNQFAAGAGMPFSLSTGRTTGQGKTSDDGVGPAKEVFSASSNVSKDCLKTHQRTWHNHVPHAVRRGSVDRPEAWPQPAPASCWTAAAGRMPQAAPSQSVSSSFRQSAIGSYPAIRHLAHMLRPPP